MGFFSGLLSRCLGNRFRFLSEGEKNSVEIVRIRCSQCEPVPADRFWWWAWGAGEAQTDLIWWGQNFRTALGAEAPRGRLPRVALGAAFPRGLGCRGSTYDLI